MKSAPIQIRNPAVVSSIRELSDLTGQPITEAVARAVAAQLQREKQTRSRDHARQHAAIRAIVERVKQLPIVGPELTDDDLYDEDGLPK